jgi:hypothetical protein
VRPIWALILRVRAHLTVVAIRDIALAIPFTIIMSTKHVAVRLIGTVIILG